MPWTGCSSTPRSSTRCWRTRTTTRSRHSRIPPAHPLPRRARSGQPRSTRGGTSRRARRDPEAQNLMSQRLRAEEWKAAGLRRPALVTGDALRAIARRVRRMQIPAGEMVLCQGEPGDTIFFIERGRCRLVIEKPPSIVTVAVLAEGDFFGEGACVLGRSQQASVYAQTECYLLALDRQSLHAVLAGRDGDGLDELRRLAEQRFNLFADISVQATWGQLLEEATVVGVYSPKGGSGGTCISLNLVGALARSYPGEVMLLDLDFPYSHSALLAGLVPTSCLARMSSVPQE